MTTWARPTGGQFSRFCALRTEASRPGESNITYCNGRWAYGTECEIATAPGKDGCAACRTVVGLLELKHATAVETIDQPIWELS